MTYDEIVDIPIISKPSSGSPGLVNRWLQGDRKPAKCISCNSCFKPGLEEGGIYCVVEKKSRKRRPEVSHMQDDEKQWLPICALFDVCFEIVKDSPKNYVKKQ